MKVKEEIKILNEFRLICASEILSNLLDTNGLLPGDADNIYYIDHMIELCEQYSLFVFLQWLFRQSANKRYREAIYSGNHDAINSILSLSSFRQSYPFNLSLDKKFIRESSSKLFEFLEKNALKADAYLAGALYQLTLAYPMCIRREEQKYLAYIDKKFDKRSGGEFYTPYWIARYCVEQWLDNCVSEKLIRILDPSCGCGNFFIAVIRVFAEQKLEGTRLLDFVKNSIYGIDIDAKAVEVAKCSILLEISQEKIALSQEELVELFAYLDEHIQVADTLLLGITHLNKTSKKSIYSTNSANPEQLKQKLETENFDLIIGNPPYISFGARDQKQLKSQWQKVLKKFFPSSSEYKIRYSSIFQELSVHLLKESGQTILFVPDAFLTGSYYRKLREFICQNTEIISLSEFPDDSISGATVGRWCVSQLKRKKINSQSDIDKKLQEEKIILRSIQNRAMPSSDIVELKKRKEFQKLEIKEFHITKRDLVSKDKSRFQLIFSDEDLEIFQLCFDLPTMGSILEGHTGIRAKNGQKSIISNSKLGDKYFPGLISGSEISHFFVSWQGNYLYIEPLKLYAGGFDKEIIANPKILLRQTGDSLQAACDSKGLYHLNNIHSFCLNKEFSQEIRLLDSFVAILNSSFMHYFYALKTREKGRALAQIDIETVENLPCPQISKLREIQILISSLVRELNAQLIVNNRENLPIQEINMLYKEIDELVFQAYNLSERHIEHILKYNSITKNSSLFRFSSSENKKKSMLTL